MTQIKTNAMRILDSKQVNYNILTYESKDGQIDGVSVAHKIGKDLNSVYKTLVTQGNSKNTYVFVIPVERELDLKKAAKVAGEKKIEMIHVKDIVKLTGYIRGGCSPIGMKKQYKTFIALEARELGQLVVSAGKIGSQIELEPAQLINVTEAELEDITKE